ncbi:MAG: helix-turn-helix domain-containing protein [Muribaculaceae bacterium]|nr:helix-turn-helix domain-containing protein [Muribaculaceae bacterium]
MSPNIGRIDLVRLRKRAGISQRELADLLQVRPSFLSAIENGKSRLPEEKLEKIKEIFELEDLEEYIINDYNEISVAPHTHEPDQSDYLTQLLNHFHDLAHQRDKSNVDTNADLSARVNFLSNRNNRLSQRVDDLREEIDTLRAENLRLKELLLKNGIGY